MDLRYLEKVLHDLALSAPILLTHVRVELRKKFFDIWAEYVPRRISENNVESSTAEDFGELEMPVEQAIVATQRIDHNCRLIGERPLQCPVDRSLRQYRK